MKAVGFYLFFVLSLTIFWACGGEESETILTNCEPDGIFRCAENNEKHAEVCLEGEWNFFGSCEDDYDYDEMKCEFIDKSTEPRCVLKDESRYETGDSGDTGNTGNTGDTGNSGDSGDSGDTGNTGNTGGCISNADCNDDQMCENNECRNIFNRSWKIQVHKVELSEEKPNGENWDPWPFEPPDIFVMFFKNDTEIFRTETIEDSCYASWSSAYESTVVFKEDSFSFMIYDDDDDSDDLVSIPSISSSNLGQVLKIGEITEKDFNISSDGVESFKVTFQGE